MRLLLGLSLSALVVATGCGSCIKSAGELALEKASGGQVNIGDNGKMTVKTDKGTANIDFSKNGMKVDTHNADGTHATANYGTGSTVPAGFPLPVFSGMKIINSAMGTDPKGKRGFMLMGMVDGKTAEEVAAFYEPALKKAGYTVAKTEVTANGGHVIGLTGKLGDNSGAAVHITETKDKKQVAVMISGSAP